MGLGRNMARGASWFQRHLLVEMSAVAFAFLLGQGWLTDRSLWSALTAVFLVLLLFSRIYAAWGRFVVRRDISAPDTTGTLQLELLLLSTMYLLMQITGGQESPLYPFLYLLLAAAGGFDRRWQNALLLVVVALAFEMLSFAAATNASLGNLAAHVGAIISFPFMVALLVRAWTSALRHEVQAEQERERLHVELEADLYRRTSGVLPSVDQSAEKRLEHRQRSSAKELGLSVRNLLEIVKAAFRPNTVALFMLSTDEKTVKLKYYFSDAADALVQDTIPAGEGIIGAILKKKGTVSLTNIRDASPSFTYYRGKAPLRSFIGVPVLENEIARGVLLADRKVDIPFGDDDEELLKVVAGEIWRTFQTEGLLFEMDEEIFHTNLFYEASKQLNQTVSVQEVVDEILSSIRKIYPMADFTAMVVRDSENRHLVLRGMSVAAEFERWRDEQMMVEIEEKNNLCALAVQTGSVLPRVPFYKMKKEQRLIFGKTMLLPGIESLKVFPLKVAAAEKGKSVPGEEKVLGVMAVGSKSKALFPENQAKAAGMIGMLETTANIAAMAIQSAQRHELLERQATTDGLTGLNNHRRFQEILEEAVAEAMRYRSPLSMILADVDHFKKVNDSYGHPVGDEVLKRVARVLAELARATDRVCRYGGEEFAVIMPQTDPFGGRNLAERFREEIKKQKFRFDGKEFAISVSLGICTLPEFSRHKQELIDRTDQALYHAKHEGRDRTVHFADIGRKPVPGSDA